MPEIILDDITEVTMEIQNGSEDVNFEVSSTNPVVRMGSTDPVVVRIERNYAELNNKPSINHHVLNAGENSFPYLGLNMASTSDIDLMFFRGG